MDENICKMFNGYYEIDANKAMKGNMNKKKPLSLSAADKLKNYAGRLLEDIIMVDFDNRDQSEKMMQYVIDEDIQCNVIQTTKGKHFYFKADQVLIDTIKATVDTLTPLGFKVDYKLGAKYGYSPLKINGKYRKILKSVETMEYLPLFLEPVRNLETLKKITKTDGNFYAYGDGSGRNTFLMNYMIYLSIVEDYSNEDIIDLFNVINKYVFSQPLRQYELNTICRRENFEGIQNLHGELMFYGGKNGKTFLHNEFARFIRKEHHVVKLNGVAQIFIDGMYHDDIDRFHGAMIKHIDKLKDSQRRETLRYLESSLDTCEVQEADPKYIRVNNGIYDTHAVEFKDVNTDLVFKNKINIEYNEHISCAIVDHFMDDFTCGDKEVEDLIWELFGYCMDRKQRKKVMFFLYGPTAHNGKSTLLEMMSQFLGHENISNVEPQDLGGQNGRFNKILLYGKLANIVDDVDSGYIENTGLIKSMVDGRMINADRKNLDPIKFKNYATFVFGGNAIPKSKDKTDGWMDRLIIIPCNAHFPPGSDKLISNMDELITTDEARSYIFNKALEGYYRLNEHGFTVPKSVVDAKKNYKIHSNTFLQFMDEEEVDFSDTYLSELYLRYTIWCDESGVTNHVTKSQIRDDVCYNFGFEVGDLKRKGGEPHRYFVKSGQTQLKIV